MFHMITGRKVAWILALALCLPVLALSPRPAHAIRVLAVVNDVPVTDFDVRQRMKLHRVLGMKYPSAAVARKRALQSLIDDAVLMAEARRLGMQVEETQVEAAVRNMARGMGGMDRLKAALRKQGLTMDQLRDFIRAQIVFRAIAARNGFKPQVKVSEAEVERRLKKILSDPRLKPITIWRLRQAMLPVENVSPVMRDQLLLARAVEAQQIMRKYRGCNSLKKAASGIFNVKVSPIIDADPRKLPAPLKKALRQAGTKRLVGPIRAPGGIQLIGFCGTRTIRPKLPVGSKKQLRERLRASLQQEKLSRQVETFMKKLRRKAIIEWRTKRS